MKNTSLVAAIDIGSKYLRMVIAEINENGKITILEDVRKKTSIGKDTFTDKKIKIDTINTTSASLIGFKKLMRDYNIKKYTAVATSGIREAINKDYVLEQIRLKTGLNVEIINNAQERFYVLKGLQQNSYYKDELINKGVLIVNIGSGGVEISIYKSSKLVYTKYIKLGSLRIREILSHIEKISLDFSTIVEEYVQSKIYPLKKEIESLKIASFIGLGGELDTLSKMVSTTNKSGIQFINNQNFEKIYSSIKNTTSDQLMSKLNIDKKEADLLMPSIIIFNSFLSMTESKGIYLPTMSLRHGIVENMKDMKLDKKKKTFFINDIENLLWEIGEKYNIDAIHTKHVQKLALTIFDKSKRIHKLDYNERIYLQCAAILHDSGKYINLNEDEIYGHNLIISEDILGFSNRESAIIANIVRYHGEQIPQKSHYSYNKLDHNDKILVSKLVAILKLAESLDISHKNKINNIKVNISGDELIIRYSSIHDTLLEEWSFNNNSIFFEEVMGIKPVLNKKLF